MLPEAGAFELVFLAMVALIVVGPKDLPVLLRKVGQFTAKMRGLAAEFRSSFDEMARQSELDELRREVEALREGRFGEGARPAVESHIADIHRELSFDALEGAVSPPAALAPSVAPPAGEAARPAEPAEPLPLAHAEPHAGEAHPEAARPTPAEAAR